SNEPEIITQIGRVPIYGNMISVAKSKNTSFICRFSGDSFYEYKVRNGWQKIPTYIVRNIIGRIPLQTGTSFIVMGPTGKRRLIKRGVPPEKVKILPPPIDAARFNTQVETDLLDIPSNRSIALFVGRRTRMKGIGVLERTIPEIIDRRSDIQFVLVGGDDGRPNIPKKYKEYITIVGEVKPELMPSVYEQADLLIHPSLIEGLSRAVLEAILSEIPVVVRNVGDLDYATSNTFDTEDEFIDMVCNFEDLPTEDASKFTVRKLQREYINYFKSVI
ncbi:MAG: glycosyltransferase family 4 protein, partial [Candidatus Paceibacteria bacterium]